MADRPKTVSFYCADCDKTFDRGADLFDHVLTREHEEKAREQFVLVPPLEMDLDED